MAFAVVSLGLGIGANTAAFTVVNAMLLRPLAVESPGSLVAISAVRPQVPDYAEDRLPPEAYRRFAAETGLFSGALAWEGDYPLVNFEAANLQCPTLARVGAKAPGDRESCGIPARRAQRG